MRKPIHIFSFILATLFSLDCHALKLVRDAESEAILTQIAKPIFSVANLSSKMRVNIIQDDQINAFVLDGKNIFINTGLVTFSDDPSAIAGVIAHECGHISDGHIVRQGDKMATLSKATILGAIIGIAGISSGQSELGAATIIGTNDAATNNMLGYILTQEHSADINAVNYMKKLNIPSTGLIKLLNKLGYDSRSSGYSQIPSHLRTHPLSRQRVDFITRHQTYDKNKTSTLITADLQHKFSMVSAKIYAFTHAPASTMQKYNGAKDSDLYAQSIALFRSHKLTAAIAKLDILLKAHPADPYLYELKGQFHLESGDLKPAIINYNKAYALEPKSPLIQIQLAMSLIHEGGNSNLHQAIKLLQTAANTEPLSATIWRQMSKAYGKTGNIFAYQVALAQEAYLLENTPQKVKFLAIAKKHLNASNDRFINQVYLDLLDQA